MRLTRPPRIRFAMLGPSSNFADFGSALYMLVRLLSALSLHVKRHAPSSGGYLDGGLSSFEKMNEIGDIGPIDSRGASTDVLDCGSLASQGFEIRVVLAIEA